MFQNNISSTYPRLGSRRHSFSNSIPSSKYTENDFICTRPQCHCDAANCEEIDPNESMISMRRHTEYYHRPPVLNAHRDHHMSEGSPYSYFHYNKNMDTEYCEQCQFCSVSSRWCGRLPSHDTVKLPRTFLGSASELDIYGPDLKVRLPNATWVQEPFIINSAQVLDENGTLREPLLPAVFPHANALIKCQSLPTNMTPYDPLRDAPNASMESLQRCRTMIQAAAQGSNCLKVVRDTRCTREENWAIEEGSLVISIPSSFVDLPQQLIAPDEFELRSGGEVFVVCRMFADMWALCARLRLSESVAALEGADLQNSANVKFLPLCSVTLAANFGAFYRRCTAYRQRFPLASVFPSGGNRIQPPERKESLEASRRFFNGPVDEMLPLPQAVYEICKAPTQIAPSTDYVPVDIHAENPQTESIASKHAPYGQGTLRRLWGKLIPKEPNSSNADKRETSGNQQSNPTEPNQTDGSTRGQGNSGKGQMRKRKSIGNLFRPWKHNTQEEENTHLK